MNRSGWRRGLGLGLVLASALSVGCNDGSAAEDLFLSNYFVKLDPGTAAVAGLVTDLSVAFDIKPIYTFDKAAQGFTVKMPDVLVPELEEFDGVEWVAEDGDKDYVPPEDPGEPPLIGSDEIPAALARIGGPYTGALDFSQVHVAVVDTGAEVSHPDLNIVHFEDVVSRRTGDSNDGEDPAEHGTHVSGTIGAYGDGEGMVGVAPGIPIHAVRVLDDNGSGTWGDIIAGLEYVLDHPEIRVVNMSLGGPRGGSGPDPLEEAIQALEDAGVVVCIAAGNETQDTSGVAPAGYDIGVVVSAYDTSGGDNGFAYFSNYGDAVDIAAPGVDIYSTWPGGSYNAISGTSMATPHVAGAVAVYLALNPNKTPEQVRTALKNRSEEGYSGQGGDHPEPLLDLTQLWGE